MHAYTTACLDTKVTDIVRNAVYLPVYLLLSRVRYDVNIQQHQREVVISKMCDCATDSGSRLHYFGCFRPRLHKIEGPLFFVHATQREDQAAYELLDAKFSNTLFCHILAHPPSIDHLMTQAISCREDAFSTAFF